MINGTDLSETIGQALNDKLAEMTLDGMPDWCDSRHIDELVVAVMDVLPDHDKPIDMILFCPRCSAQHVDAPEPDLGPNIDGSGDMPLWNNPVHRSHLCHACSFIWRPADVPTNGVAAIETRGTNDSPALPPVPHSKR